MNRGHKRNLKRTSTVNYKSNRKQPISEKLTCLLVADLKKQTQREKTVTRTFRLDAKLHRILEEAAAKEKITVNSLVSRALWDHQNRCQYFLHYNLLLVEPDIIKAMLDRIPEEEMAGFGSSLGPTIVKENLARQGRSVDRESVEFVIAEVLGHWTKWYDADVSETGKGRVYYLHHVLGKKWSAFLKGFLEQAISKLLGLNVLVEMTENSVMFTMSTTAKPFKPL